MTVAVKERPILVESLTLRNEVSPSVTALKDVAVTAVAQKALPKEVSAPETDKKRKFEEVSDEVRVEEKEEVGTKKQKKETSPEEGPASVAVEGKSAPASVKGSVTPEEAKKPISVAEAKVEITKELDELEKVYGSQLNGSGKVALKAFRVGLSGIAFLCGKGSLIALLNKMKMKIKELKEGRGEEDTKRAVDLEVRIDALIGRLRA